MTAAIIQDTPTELKRQVMRAVFVECKAHSPWIIASNENVDEHLGSCNWCRNQMSEFSLRFGERTSLTHQDLDGLPPIYRRLFAVGLSRIQHT